TALNAEEGEVVVSGTMNKPGSGIGTISDLSEILAEVDVDETEIAFLELGQSATLTVDALTDREFSGRVVEIGSSGFSRPRNPDVTYFKAKILLDAPDEALRPGMSTRVEITTAVAEEALVIPVQSVVERPPLDADSDDDEEVDVVFVVTESTSEQRAVEIGLADITHVQIVSGLEVGEKVVTGPYRSLKKLEHEDPVRVRKQGEDEEDKDD
ncbi:MAG: efflux RND transporter periplasmic adaptor subunit, partial [Acidobacteria bacterium]|nr:efflux RND transporter periplasmic adaptor subunit [Acidobacteriota bacterium]